MFSYRRETALQGAL